MIAERTSPPDFPLFQLQAPVDDCRICAAAGDFWLTTGGNRPGQIGGLGHESEHDRENGSSWTGSSYSRDSDASFCDLNRLAERFCMHAEDQFGSDHLLAVHSLIPSTND